jgi:hypothetical protein
MVSSAVASVVIPTHRDRQEDERADEPAEEEIHRSVLPLVVFDGGLGIDLLRANPQQGVLLCEAGDLLALTRGRDR